MNHRIYLCLAIIALASSQAFAQLAGNPDNWCREGFFTRETKNFGVGFVKPKAGQRAYFYTDDPTICPVAASCRTTSYTVAGDAIITSKNYKDFVCGWFTSSKGGVKVGWLKTADLEFPLMVHNASERVWTGQWEYASNSVSFTPSKLDGFLNVTGDALWKGMGDNVHIGELDGRFPHKDGVLEYSDGTSEFDCRATMQLAIEKYLIVADNGNCGGANVTFSGIYRKVSSKPGVK